SGVGPILATDVLPHRVEAARASGADDTRLTRLDGQPDDVADWGPVDVAFEVAGEEAALETALHTVRPGGRVVVVGTPPSDRHSFEASLARRKGLTISLLMRPKAHHMLRAIELVDDGAVDLSGIITERFALSEGPAAFEALARRGGLKIVVKPSE
ncbi:MAG: zinc-binding dehydrogenase, partial [Chloroflexota bacterium]